MISKEIENLDHLNTFNWLKEQGIPFLSVKGLYCPKIFIPVIGKSTAGLFLWVRKKSNKRNFKCKKESIDWILILRNNNYDVQFANGFEHAKDIILDHISLVL